MKDREKITEVFDSDDFKCVINLAAQAGVRYSLENPYCYIDSNILGFINILEACRKHDIDHLIFASSSSVYGANTRLPFSTLDNADHPISLYAATKKADELMAHSYAALYGLPCTGLRFFTVYGPYGRPDMAYFMFTKAILESKPIRLFNYGRMKRDFTYVDDVVKCIMGLIGKKPVPCIDWDGTNPEPSTSFAPYRIYNIGNNEPIEIQSLVSLLEDKLGTKAKLEYLPMQPGDVEITFADVEDLVKELDFRPQTSIEEGIGKFVDWYLRYY